MSYFGQFIAIGVIVYAAIMLSIFIFFKTKGD